MHVLGTCTRFAPHFIFSGCRANQWTEATQTLWADGHHRGQYSLGYPVISGTSSTRQRGENTGTSGQGHHDAVYKNDLGCTLHVLGTCIEFAPLFIYSRPQAKPIDLHGSKFVSRQPFGGGGGASAIVVTCPGRHKRHVPEGGRFISVDPPSL